MEVSPGLHIAVHHHATSLYQKKTKAVDHFSAEEMEAYLNVCCLFVCLLCDHCLSVCVCGIIM